MATKRNSNSEVQRLRKALRRSRKTLRFMARYFSFQSDVSRPGVSVKGTRQTWRESYSTVAKSASVWCKTALAESQVSA